MIRACLKWGWLMRHCDWLKNVAEQLANRRRDLLKSQQDLERELGLSERQISKWERGVRRPTAFFFYCWADALDCDVVLKPREENKHDA